MEPTKSERAIPDPQAISDTSDASETALACYELESGEELVTMDLAYKLGSVHERHAMRIMGDEACYIMSVAFSLEAH